MKEDPLNKKRKRRLRYKFEFFPNQNMVGIHTNVQFGREFISVGSDSYGISRFSGDESKIPDVLKHVEHVEGVVGAHVRDYEIHVTKGDVFSWEEILPAIEAILALDLNETDEPPEKQEATVHPPNLNPYGIPSDLDWP